MRVKERENKIVNDNDCVDSFENEIPLNLSAIKPNVNF